MRAATPAGGGGVFRWDGKQTEAVPVFRANGNPVTDPVIHPKVPYIPIVGQDGSARCIGQARVQVKKVASGKAVHTIPLVEGCADSPISDMVAVAFSPDGAELAVGDANSNLQFWDWEKDVCAFTFEISSSPLSQIRRTPTDILLVEDEDGYVRLLHAPLP